MKSSSSAIRAIVLAFSLLSLSSVCRADVIYTLIPQLVSGVAVTGSITTNGTIGVLSSADIVAYSISMQMPSDPGQPREWVPPLGRCCTHESCQLEIA